MVVTTSSQLFVKTPQYVEETTEGTTPTASPTFTSCGPVDSLSIKIDGKYVDVAQLGPEDLEALVQGNQSYETKMKCFMTASTFLKYSLNAANYATPSGSISTPLSIVFSVYLNGTENYVFLKGSRAKTVTITNDIGKPIEFTVDMVHTSITTPSSSHGLTTPTFAATPSAAVWTWTTGGTAPITIGGSGVNAKKFSLTINRNTSEDWTLGNLDPFSSQPHGRRINGDVSILWTATTNEVSFKADTAQTITCVLKSATSTITATGCKFTSLGRDDSAGQTEATPEVLAFKALSVTVT